MDFIYSRSIVDGDVSYSQSDVSNDSYIDACARIQREWMKSPSRNSKKKKSKATIKKRKNIISKWNEIHWKHQKVFEYLIYAQTGDPQPRMMIDPWLQTMQDLKQ